MSQTRQVTFTLEIDKEVIERQVVTIPAVSDSQVKFYLGGWALNQVTLRWQDLHKSTWRKRALLFVIEHNHEVVLSETVWVPLGPDSSIDIKNWALNRMILYWDNDCALSI